MTGNEDNFISRWSKRKRAVEKEETQAEENLAPDQETPEETVPAEDEESRANREAAEAVNIDELAYESDFSLFMRRGVPAALKKQAMRKLWTSNPILANLDGLNDYEEDFNNPAHNVYKSAWKAGRGYLVKLVDETKKKAIETLSEPTIDVPAEETEVSSASKGAVSSNAEEPTETQNPRQEETDEIATNLAEDDQAKKGEASSSEPDQLARVSIRRRLNG